MSRPDRSNLGRFERSGAFPILTILFLLSVSQSGCAAASLETFEVTPPPTATASRDLRVQLIFGEEADLDLYVTGPGSETVYFGNNPARSGALLDADRRCHDPKPRIETVIVSDPQPGQYRVGVEFAEKCRALRGAVPYRIEVVAKDLRITQSGEIEAGRFENIALEFDLDTIGGAE